MARSHLLWYRTLAKAILKDVGDLKQADIAREIGESRQVVSYRIKNVWQEELEDMIRVLNMAGYEIVSKE